MTPCQVSMQPAVVEESSNKPKDMSLRCVSNCEDTAFDMEALGGGVGGVVDNVEVEIDIVGGGCTTSTDGGDNGCRLGGGREGDDETDAETDGYSSSFGNTCSGNDDGRMSDSEVDSIFGDSNLFDGLDSMFRTGKKVTAQWRRYISPLTWRGKWIELRMKEMKSQLFKYDRELASYGQRRQHLELGQCTSENCSAKSLPYCGQSHKKEVMKRRKRKRIEDMNDVSAYMSHHNLFSYYENKKFDADGASVDDDPAIQVIAADVNNNDDFDNNYACPSLELRDENSLEHVLWKIDIVQSRVQKLKSQIETLLTENAGKFSSVESLTELAESDDPTCSPGSPALSAGNVDTIPVGAQYTPTRHITDNPESAVSSYEEAPPNPDIIECSMAPSSEEVPLDQSYFLDSCQNIVNDVLVHQEVKKEPQEFENVSVHHRVNPEMLNVKVENVIDIPPTVRALRSELSQEANTAHGNSVLESSLPSDFHGPTKRKRGERKPSSGPWSGNKIGQTIHS